MKKIIGFFVALSLLLSVPSVKLLAQSFEGTIYWTMTMPMLDEDKHDMKINIKGDKVETEMDMGVQGEVKGYLDAPNKKMYTVMEAMKAGFVMDIPSDSAAQNSMKATTGDAELKKTGEKATIAGHPAEEYVLKTDKADVSIWETGDFPKEMVATFNHAMASQPGRDPKVEKAMKQLALQGFIPVKVVAKQAGEVAMSMEFVKYEQRKLDDALFVPPTDIKFQPMPHMGGGMN